VPSENWIDVWEHETPRTVSRTCGWCRTAVEMYRVSRSVELWRMESPPGVVRVGALYVCPRDDCHRPSLVLIEFHYDHATASSYGQEVVGQLPRGTAELIDGLPPRSRTFGKRRGAATTAATTEPPS
jgi:hypothetical protein